MIIKHIKQITNGQWLVLYDEPMACGCGYNKRDIIIHSVEKPQESEIIRFISEKVK